LFFGHCRVYSLTGRPAVAFDDLSGGVQAAVEGFTAGAVDIADIRHEMMRLIRLYFFTAKSALHDFLLNFLDLIESPICSW
jgi:hypothetical protein